MKRSRKTPAKPSVEAALVGAAPGREVVLPNSVKLRTKNGEVELDLVPPASLAIRNQVTYAALKSEDLAVAAALGLCSRRVGNHVKYRYDALAYGLEVTEFLLGEGCAYLDILNAGRIAWAVLSEGLIPGKEVDEVEAFFGPTRAGSTT